MRVAWIGIALALLGALVLTGVDFALTPRALFGDALALAGAVLAALYVTVGEKVRATTSNPTYTSICYGVAALGLLVLVLVGGVPLVGFSVRDWVLIALITLGAQLLGHTVVDRVLATTSATIVSLAILLEMPGSTAIAAAWLGQVPPAIIPAVVLMFAGIAMVISTTTRPGDPPARPHPPERPAQHPAPRSAPAPRPGAPTPLPRRDRPPRASQQPLPSGTDPPIRTGGSVPDGRVNAVRAGREGRLRWRRRQGRPGQAPRASIASWIARVRSAEATWGSRSSDRCR